MSPTSVPGYLQALGFERSPFPVTPDPEGFFFSPRLTRQFAELRHFIELRKGFMLVTGDVGVGKSTLTRLLLARLESEGTRTALVFNTFLQGLDLLRAITRDFGIQVSGDGLEVHLQALNNWLLTQYVAGHNCVLILDDAQGLDIASLELVRQLSNLETNDAKLLQIVMVAQPEIDDMLARHDLRQLSSRISLRLELTPLELEEVDHYLHHRLQLSGGAQALSVDASALKLLHGISQGYIRRLHMIMDRCLFGLVARNRRRVDKSLVLRAARELGLQVASSSPGLWRRLRWKLPLLALGIGASAYAVQTLQERVMLPTTPPSIVIDQEKVEWERFLENYPGLNWSGGAPASWQEVLSSLSGEQSWLPVRLSDSSLVSCQGHAGYDLDNGRLAFFQTALPTLPVPFGTANQQVLMLQQALAEQQLLSAGEVDGHMGPVTAAALTRFQQQHGLLAVDTPELNSAYLLTCVYEGIE